MNLHYIEAGSGKPMILLHGNGEDSTYFKHQLEYFSKSYRVIAVDTRGHGKSPRGDGAFTLKRFADDLKQFMDELGIRKAIILGFSDGGNIALLFALKYPKRVDRLIVNGANLNPFGVKPLVGLSVLKDYVAAVMKKDWKQEEILGLMVKEPWIRPEHLSRIQMPALVIVGDKDMIADRHSQAIARELGNGIFKRISGSHFVAAEEPEEFNRAVEEFLTQTGAGAPVGVNLPEYDNEILNKMKKSWHDRVPGKIDRMQVRNSAVLLPLIEKNGEFEVLFEVRAASLHRQPGEVCFPGGRVEDGESNKEAAYRETLEELLLKPEQVEVLAPLDVLEASGGVNVYPFLGVLKDYNGTFSADEVNRVFSVPLSWLLEHEPERYQCTVHTVPNEDFPFDLIPGGREYHWRKGHYDVYFYRYGDEIIWGMTAKILYSFVKLYKSDMLEE